MNILQKYIGIISYKMSFPLVSGNYLLKVSDDLYNVSFNGNIDSIDYYNKIGMNGVKEDDKKYCWITLLVNKENNELSKGTIQTIDKNNVINELNFYSPTEVNRVYRTFVDDNDNMICKYDYDFEKFKVLFEMELKKF